MEKAVKKLTLALIAGSAWMICAVLLPTHHARGMNGDLMAMASCLFITQAYADDSQASSSDDASKSEDDSSKSGESEAKSSDDSSKSSSSSSYDFSSATLVCVSKTSLESTLGISSSSDSSKSEDDSSKSSDDSAKSSDDSSSSSSESSDDSSSDKVTICHVPPGNEDNPQTLSVASSAVDAHLSNHPGDHVGACDSSEDSSTKSDEASSKSGDDNAKSSDSSSSSSSSSTLDALPSCTALSDTGASEDGVWVPDSAVGDSSALTAYIDQVQGGGGSSLPDNSMQSYREIRGQ